MGSTAVDSLIFRDIFSTEAMRRIWSDENRIQKYLDIEVALAKVQAQLGIIPAEAAAEIAKHGEVSQFNLPKLKERTEAVGYPVLPVVE
ncbi:MAG: 3-carboxy-cis,cis-muconate cycloisomerase, partial [Limisphaerales bacterium]